MHLLIPHAGALGEEAAEALAALSLPRLAARLGTWQPVAHHGEDEFSPDMPHECALAALRGEAPAVAAWRTIAAASSVISTERTRPMPDLTASAGPAATVRAPPITLLSVVIPVAFRVHWVLAEGRARNQRDRARRHGQ